MARTFLLPPDFPFNVEPPGAGSLLIVPMSTSREVKPMLLPLADCSLIIFDNLARGRESLCLHGTWNQPRSLRPDTGGALIPVVEVSLCCSSLFLDLPMAFVPWSLGVRVFA